MSVSIIEHRLARYKCRMRAEEMHALREKIAQISFSEIQKDVLPFLRINEIEALSVRGQDFFNALVDRL